MGSAAATGADSRLLEAHATRGRRARNRAGLDALPAALAARRARYAAVGRTRTGDRARAAAGLRSRRGRLGAGAVRAAAARLPAGLARRAVPRRRGRLVPPVAARRQRPGRAVQSD